MAVRGRRNALDHLQPTASVHPGLWIARYLTQQTVHRGDQPDELGRKARDELLSQVVNREAPPDYRVAFNRWKAGFDDAVGRGRAVAVEGAAVGRVAVGIGAKGATEVGLALHHTWGVPVLPGSSLKGIAALGAHTALEGDEWRRRHDSRLARPEGPNAFDGLFGDVEEQGAVIFHDAWWVPTAGNGLSRDVITVHHPDYYQKGDEPSDRENPNPVPFLTAKGTFLVVVEAHPSLPDGDARAWLRAAYHCLRIGLERHGVGAKTNAGYGRVTLPEWVATTAGAAEGIEIAREADRIRRLAMATARERIDDVIRCDRGPSGVRAWLQVGGAPAPGIAADWPHVVAAMDAVKVPTALLHPDILALKPKSNPVPVPVARRPLGDHEITALVGTYTKKGATDWNRVAGALVGVLHPDDADRAASELVSLGAKNGHVKQLREDAARARGQ
jgi:CRISPR-associated protein Cmr6